MPDPDHGQADRNAQHQQNEKDGQTADSDDLALGHRARTPRRVWPASAAATSAQSANETSPGR